MVSKEKVKKKKKKKKIFFFTFLYLRKTDMVLGKKVAIFDWEWGRNSAPIDWQKIPCACTCISCLSNLVQALKE